VSEKRIGLNRSPGSGGQNSTPKHRKGQTASNRPARSQAKAVTGESLVRAYKKELEHQRRQVRKADLAQNRLIFVVNALRKLLADRQFELLLRAAGDTVQCLGRTKRGNAISPDIAWDSRPASGLFHPQVSDGLTAPGATAEQRSARVVNTQSKYYPQWHE
jgi:hypothetical protein